VVLWFTLVVVCVAYPAAAPHSWLRNPVEAKHDIDGPRPPPHLEISHLLGISGFSQSAI
jgi:hypothetical protein